MYPGAHRCKTKSGSKYLGKAGPSFKTGTVTGCKTLDIKGVQGFHRGLELGVIGKAEMGASNNSMYRATRQLFLNVVEDIDETCMGTAEDENQSLHTVHNKGLVIAQWVLPELAGTI